MSAPSVLQRARTEAGPVITTVAPADIRGLVTTLLVPSDAFLDLGTRVERTRLLTLPRVAPIPGPRLCPGSLLLSVIP